MSTWISRNIYYYEKAELKAQTLIKVLTDGETDGYKLDDIYEGTDNKNMIYISFKKEVEA